MAVLYAFQLVETLVRVCWCFNFFGINFLKDKQIWTFCSIIKKKKILESVTLWHTNMYVFIITVNFYYSVKIAVLKFVWKLLLNV